MTDSLAVFEGYNIRRHYDEKTETWYFSVVDIIQVLIQQPDYQTARKYWNKLKERLKNEGSQTVTNCHQLKMVADDGKMRLTDVANAETLLRLIQSVPSPKAEPIKLWLAKVGYERMQLLYTWQNPDWDITKEKRDPSYGHQRWKDTLDKLQLLYEKLEKKVGTLDFVWCYTGHYTKSDHWMLCDISRLWELSVPSSKIFQFLDSNIWSTMLQSVENKKQPEDICWNQLLVERNEGMKRLSAGNNGNITPLVLVPLCTSIRVDDRSKFSTGLAIPVKYEDLPTSECEAKRCRNEGYQRKSWRQRNKIKRTYPFAKLMAGS